MEQKLSRSLIPTLTFIASTSFTGISGLLIDFGKIISPESSQINVLALIFAAEWLTLMAIIGCVSIGVLAKIFFGNYAYLIPVAFSVPTLFYLGAFWATRNPEMWLTLIALSALVFLFFGSFFTKE